MKRHSLVLTAVILATVLGPEILAQAGPDNASVQKVSEAFTEAINKGDGKAAAALFTADGDYTSSTGRMAQGAAQIEKLVMDQASGAFKGMSFKVTTTNVRAVTADVAIGNGTFEGGGAKPRKGITTMVLVRQAGTWKIAALRAMIPVP